MIHRCFVFIFSVHDKSLKNYLRLRLFPIVLIVLRNAPPLFLVRRRLPRRLLLRRPLRFRPIFCC